MIYKQATDRDLPPNSDITYTITDGDPYGNFSLDASTGQLAVTAPLDYEALDPALGGRLMLKVKVADKGQPPLSDEVTVVVELKVRGKLGQSMG